MLKLFLLINQVFNLPKQIFSIKIHLLFQAIELVDLVWTTISMSPREPGKEELSLIMELIGGQFVMIQISTWLQLMFFADLSIQDSELSAGEALEAYHIPEQEIFLMGTKNQFWWTMFHVQEMKITLVNAHINQ